MPVVARHPAVREVMRERQRALADEGNAVIEGRDIGSVVAPGADVKVSLGHWPTGSEAQRPGADAEALAADLRERDARDAVNTQPADDAVLLDTTDLDVDGVVTRIVALVEARVR